MRELSLFTGAGGGLLGSLILGWEPVQFVEHDAYCQRVLAARFPDVPRHLDVRDFRPVPGSCDIVTGGFPCQPHSQAGNRLGGLDSRDLWPDTLRVLRESDAPLGFFENVPGLLTSRDAHGRSMFGGILGDLSEAGFNAEWCVLGADDVGAPHRRKRLWILAYSPSLCRAHFAGINHERRALVGAGTRSGGGVGGWDSAEGTRLSGRPQESGCESDVADSPWWCDPADVADAGCGGDECRGGLREPSGSPKTTQGEVAERQRGRNADCDCSTGADPWLAQPHVGRVAAGVASRVDRLRALGNGQVPQTMAAAFTYLAGEAGVLM